MELWGIEVCDDQLFGAIFYGPHQSLEVWYGDGPMKAVKMRQNLSYGFDCSSFPPDMKISGWW